MKSGRGGTGRIEMGGGRIVQVNLRKYYKQKILEMSRMKKNYPIELEGGNYIIYGSMR